MTNRDYAQSPFYRVATRLVVFDDRQRLLVVENVDHEYEIPGGGWEHEETFEACLRRECQEELGVAIADIGEVLFMYRANNAKNGYRSLRCFVSVIITDHNFKHGEEMLSARFVTKDEFLRLNLCPDEGSATELVALIYDTRLKKEGKKGTISELTAL